MIICFFKVHALLLCESLYHKFGFISFNLTIGIPFGLINLFVIYYLFFLDKSTYPQTWLLSIESCPSFMVSNHCKKSSLFMICKMSQEDFMAMLIEALRYTHLFNLHVS